MKLGRYIGEFLLFRWLFGNRRHKDDYPGGKSRGDDHGYSSRDWYGEGWNSQSFDDFHEEQDDYDMMDDF